MEKKMLKQLKSLEVSQGGLSPDSVWVKENRVKLLDSINIEEKQTSAGNKFVDYLEVFTPFKMNVLARQLATLFLVVAISFAGWSATVSASSNSLPGDVLYNVKIAKEKTQLAVAGFVGGKEKRAKLLSAAAKTRAYETKELVKKKEMDKVDKTLNSLKETVKEANENLREVSEKKPEKVKEVADELTSATVEIMGTLEEVLSDMSDEKEEDSNGVAKKIVDAQKDVSHKQIEAVGLVVEKKQKGELAISEEETQDLVFKTIVKMTKDVEVSGTSTVKIINDVVASTIATTNTVSSASTTSEVIEEDNSLIGNMEEVKSQVQQANETIQVEMEDAMQLATDGQLLEALEKVKQVNDINSEIKQTVVDVSNEIKVITSKPDEEGVSEEGLGIDESNYKEEVNGGTDLEGVGGEQNESEMKIDSEETN